VRRLDGRPSGLLRIGVPGVARGSFLAEAMAEFVTLFRAARVRVLATNQHLELVGEGIDVAIGGGLIRDTTWVRRVRRRRDLWAAASLQYLVSRGCPEAALR
jgi:DNA-binding transcriptional LysR family regulator